MVFHGKPWFWLHGPAPSSAYITLFPFIITPFIISPTWVHIPPLGPHRVSMPLPLAHILGHGLEWSSEVDAAENKDKSIYGHIQQEIVPQNAKRWSGQIHLARGKKPIHELYPIIMAITLVPTGSMSLLHHIGTHDCPNPWWAMNRSNLKWGIHCYALYIMLLPLEPRAVNQRKS